jgi:hypothetical protein
MDQETPAHVSKPGKRRWRIAVALGGLAVVAAIVFWPDPKEPEYQGKKLSEWLTGPVINDAPSQIVAKEEALRHIGTNALPWLLKWLRDERPAWKEKLAEEYEMCPGPLVVGSVKRWLKHESAERLSYGALVAFQVLGTEASPAILELKGLAKSTNVHVAYMAIQAFAAMGKAAIPELVDVVTNRDAYARELQTVVMGALRQLGTNGSVVIPVLIEQLRDKDAEVVATAASLLGEVRDEPDLEIPALVRTIDIPVRQVRCSAIYALGRFGNQARLAVPSLLIALNDQEARVRETATNAILNIAPEVLKTNAFRGVHE